MAISLKRSFAAFSLAALALFGATACGNTATVDADPVTTDNAATTETTDTTQTTDDTTTDDADTSTSNAAPAADGQLTEANFAEVINSAMFDAKTVHMEGEVSVMGQTSKMSGDMSFSDDPNDFAMQMKTETMGMTMDMIIIGSKSYMNMGSMSQNKYVDLSDSDSLDEFTVSIEQNDPRAQIEALQQVMTGFEVSPTTENVNGVEAYRYVLTLDGKKMAEVAGEADALAASGGAMPDEIQQTMWVTPDGLMVKIEQKIEVEISGQKIDSTTVMYYTDWGKPVTITEPPADQIVPASTLGF